MSAALRLLWPCLLMAALFASSSVPGEVSGQEPDTMTWLVARVAPGVQNLLHVPAFGLLAWLWFRALSPRCSPRATLAAGVGLTLAYALVDEWHQAHVPGRFPSAADLAADGLGAVLAAGFHAARHARSGY